MQQNNSFIILAAGNSSRMKSAKSKILHKIAGLEIINWVLLSAINTNSASNIVLVLNEKNLDETRKITTEFLAKNNFQGNVTFTIQRNQSGTANAVQSGIAELQSKNGDTNVTILYGDTPFIKSETINKIQNHQMTFLGFKSDKENAYGRFVLDQYGNLAEIVEYKDMVLNKIEDSKLLNSGIVSCKLWQLREFLPRITNDNAKNEYYLTDIVKIATNSGEKCRFELANEEELLGINSRPELYEAEMIMQNILRNKLMLSGVTMLDAASVYLSYDTEIGIDSTIEPNVFFGNGVKIGKDVVIKAFSHIESALIEDGAVVGPFARIRPKTKIGKNSRIGNFVEIKKSTIGDGAKINHLSYIGDAEIGEDSNIGAGVITCNYDGYKKYKTLIGKNAFIGSNSSIIAPLEIGDGAIIAAGTTLTKNVEADDIVIARTEQRNVKGGAVKFRNSKRI